jgi:hypothetical protein
MNRTICVLILVACLAAPAAAQFKAEVTDSGTVNIDVGGVRLLDGFTVILPGPNWGTGGAAPANYHKQIVAPGHARVTGQMVADQPCADYTVDAVESGGGLDLAWELSFTRDLAVECVRLNGTFACAVAAGKGAWFTRKPDSLKWAQFPAALGGPGGNFGDWGFDWFGWLLPGDRGVRFRAPHGLIDMYLQDGRQWHGDIFQTCWTLAGKGTVRKGAVLRCSIRLEPLSSADLAPDAKRLGLSLIAAGATLGPAAAGVEGKIEVRSVNAKPQPMDVDWAIRDDLGAVLRRGKQRLEVPPLGTAEATVAAPEAASGDYRLRAEVRPAAGGAVQVAEARLVAAVKGPRAMMTLDGQWEISAARADETAPPPDAKWSTVTVPSTVDASTNRYWYRRGFDLPPAMQGKWLRVRFAAVNHAARVYVNGQLAGEHMGGNLPFEMDITHLLKPGRNDLWVAVQNWTAFCTKPPDSFVLKPFEHPGWKIPPGTIIAPIGGDFLRTGIWQSVSLLSSDPAYVEDVCVRTSVRKHTIEATVTVRNMSSTPRTVQVAGDISDRDGPAKKLPASTVTVGSGERQAVVLKADWANPKLWSLDDPHLYRLVTTLREGAAVLDLAPTRFGFREIWCDGPRFVLNGMPMKLFATSGWSMENWEEARAYVARIKRAGTRIMRLHTQPWQEFILDAADEMGFFIVDEAAVYCYAPSYAPADPRFWRNYADHVRGMARRDRNHPSLAIYSLENEIISCGADPKIWEPELGRLADVVREVDPTRLITCESDLDPAGKMDVIGMHYPREYWSGFTLYPDKCWWMDDEIPYIGRTYKWKRDKPLYIGEFDGGFMAWYPQYQAFWLGDEAYHSRGRFSAASPNSRARREMIEQEVEAYRYYGVTGLNPWFEPDEVDLFGPAAYAPIALAVRERTHDFFAGEKITRTVYLYNDSYQTQRLEFRWTATAPGAKTQTASETVELKPCTAAKRTVVMAAPTIPARTAMKLSLSLALKGKVVASRGQELTLFPRPKPATATAGVYVFDPAHAAALARLCPGAKTTDKLPPPADAKVVVIAPGALKAGDAPWAADLGKFVADGGSVLCLRQDAYPSRWLPVDVEIDKDFAAVMTFPRAAGHPALEGVTQDDLRFWRPDHVVMKGALVKPSRGNFVPLIDAGGIRGAIHDMNGLNWAAVLELPYGRGRYVLCQLPLVERADVEPMAGLLLRKLLDYAAGPAGPPAAHVGVVADPESSLKRALDGMRVVYDSLLDSSDGERLKAYTVIIAGGGPDAWKALRARAAALRDWLAGGGVLWLNNLSLDETDLLRDLVGGQVALQPADVTPPILAARDPVTMGLSDHELYWRDRPIWDQSTALRRVADFEVAGLPAGAVRLTDPAALVKIPVGRGYVLVNEVLWDSTQLNRIEGMKIGSILLTNLGARMDLSAFKPVNEADFQPIDIAAWCNLGLAGDPGRGWMDHGAVMTQFPTGKQMLGGVPYRIVAPGENGGRSVIGLRGAARPEYPVEVKGIKVGVHARALHFLHTAAWAGPDGAEAAAYIIHYEDGGAQRIPLRVGVEIADWYVEPAALPFAEVAWRGIATDKTGAIGAYAMRWANPYPDKVIATVDCVSADGATVPVLMALTAER